MQMLTLKCKLYNYAVYFLIFNMLMYRLLKCIVFIFYIFKCFHIAIVSTINSISFKF